MSRAFCDPRYRVGTSQTEAIESIARLLKEASASQIPIYFTVVAYRPDGRDGGLAVAKIPALRDLIIAEPAPRDDEIVITKKDPAAFFEISLVSMLVSKSVDTLILTGCSTSGCIRVTATDGICHGYRVLVPGEAVSDRSTGPHYANLFDIDAKYGDVVKLGEVIDHLFYSFTWLVGGFGLFFLLRAVDGAPSATTIAFLGGVSALGAIVAVLSVFAPSGLGPREASMYGLLLEA